MKPRARNASCVYTGRVEARMSVPIKRPSRSIARAEVLFSDGPLKGWIARLDKDSGRTTPPLAPMRGWPAGRYVGSAWVPDGQATA